MHDTYIVGSARVRQEMHRYLLVGIVYKFSMRLWSMLCSEREKEKSYGRDEKYLRKDSDGLT